MLLPSEIGSTTFKASMGPQRKGCGNCAGQGWPCLIPVLQWGRSEKAAEMLSRVPKCARAWSLQWGRSEKAAEMQGDQADGGGHADASMGPQRKGCGNSVDGADTTHVPAASMGPQRKGCGNMSNFQPCISRRLLQWGRSEKAAEIQATAVAAALADQASMGPQRKGCGNSALGKALLGKQFGNGVRAAGTNGGEERGAWRRCRLQLFDCQGSRAVAGIPGSCRRSRIRRPPPGSGERSPGPGC